MDIQTIDQSYQQLQAETRGVAQAIQAMAVMQAVHQAIQNQVAQTPQVQGFGQQQAGAGGFLGGLAHSGFAQALMMGAGFGIGDDLINSIF
ncbi:hypothetical protein [Acidithiobacillus sulfuriphilus]|uniref:Uncharacterized protein n=2 Tax=Acidithiobacillus sulfuriphilus TaxID=1867749 RepID=A0A3M8RCY3_9PROT|nr:hypothetical protein [Acidithiobacillus sulfuriphilus]RNF66458.1 hypothetical protein EC580_04580 [Acidithiobacillus sulfuriphilus]